MSQLPRISYSRFAHANLAYNYVICYFNATHLPKQFHARMLLYTSNSQQISVVYASYAYTPTRDQMILFLASMPFDLSSFLHLGLRWLLYGLYLR